MAQRVCKEVALKTVSLTEQLEFIRSMKASCSVSYRKMVNERRMKPEVAESKLNKLGAVEETLERCKLLEEIGNEMKAKVAA